MKSLHDSRLSSPARLFRSWRRTQKRNQRSRELAPVAIETLEQRTLLTIDTAVWVSQGPGPIVDGQVENVTPNNEVIGAVHTVVAHPVNADILYIGSTNGGVWKTENATAASPNWTPLTDTQASLSIGAMDMHPSDAERLVVGIGRFSSFAQEGSDRGGVLRSNDGGNTWTTPAGAADFVNRNISGIAIRTADNGTPNVLIDDQQIILAATNEFGGGLNGGLYRSIDDGATFALVPAANGLPNGAVLDLVGDANRPERFFASVQGTGIFQSDDFGATWTNITNVDPTITAAITDATADNNNTEMSVSPIDGRLFAGVLLDGQPAYIGHYNPATNTWTEMDLPFTPDTGGGADEGLNPRVKPGAQGGIHFAIVADPVNANIVYVGGDRQDSPFPNFIGANDFTGRLFRGDTFVAATGAVPSPQWEHLTHSDSIAGIPGGGTASGSAPHADAREMVFDANGRLVEVDDGGIYIRTSPRDNTGDWFSINGNLSTTEFHDIAYDTISNIIIGGTQDVGTVEQPTTGNTVWSTVNGGDGGDVAVDSTSLAFRNESIRYSSAQNLGGFTRRVIDETNTVISTENPALTLVGAGNPFDPQFTTPVVLNSVDPTRIVFGGANGLYESLDQGDTISESGAGIVVNSDTGKPLAYGGVSRGVANPDVIYAGSGAEVFVRTGPVGAFNATAFPGGSMVTDLVLDADDWKTVFAIDFNGVYMSASTGVAWTNITNNLAAIGAFDFHSIEFIASGSVDIVTLGTQTGVYVATSNDNFAVWQKLGQSLPNAPVLDLDYDPADDVLVAGTLGRGAWSLRNATGNIAPAPPVIERVVTSANPQRPDIFWSRVAGASSYDVWVGNIETGQRVVVEGVAGTSHRVTQALAQGPHRVWVRATVNGVKQPWSAPFAFRVSARPTITAPDGRVLDQMPVVRWDALQGVSRYEIWVTNRTQGGFLHLGRTVRDRITNSDPNTPLTEFKIPVPLSIGGYRVFIRTFDNNGIASSWSRGVDFFVATPPMLGNPVIPTFSNPTTFEWNDVIGSTRYELWVNRSGPGGPQRQFIFEQNVLGTSFTSAAPLPDGDYRFWVRAVVEAADGTIAKGNWSNAGTFSIGGNPMMTGPVDANPSTAVVDVTSLLPEFTWTAMHEAVRYDLYVQRTDTNRAVVIREQNLQTTRFTATQVLEAGSYRAWVRALSRRGEFSPWSAPYDFVSNGGAPTVTGPAAVVTTFTPTITWNAVDGAASYQVVLKHESNVLVNQTVNGTEFTPSNPLNVPTGSVIRAWVRAISADGQRGAWSAPREFTITIAAGTAGATLDSLPDQLRFETVAQAELSDQAESDENRSDHDGDNSGNESVAIVSEAPSPRPVRNRTTDRRVDVDANDESASDDIDEFLVGWPHLEWWTKT